SRPAYGQGEGTCTDSDGGLDYGIAGYVEGIGPNGYAYQRYDVCGTDERGEYLKEFYCNGTTPWPKRYECPGGCADGACLGTTGAEDEGGEGQPAAPSVPGATTETDCANGLDDDGNGLADGQDPACRLCFDSDGGLDYAVRGGVLDRYGGVYADTCGPAEGELLEYRCDLDGYAELLSHTCPAGCGDGACLAAQPAEPAESGALAEPRAPVELADVSGVPNVILIGWDGVQRDHFFECYDAELAECPHGLPNIEALSGGAIYNATVTSGGTATKPGWSQILSGYDAEVTGITTNSEYRPLAEGYSVFEKLEDHFGADNIVTLFVSGKSEHTGGACVGEPALHKGVPVTEDKGQPWCLVKDQVDVWENDLRRNEVVGNRALELLEAHQDDLFFAFVLFREPDVIGHVAGENSDHYSRSLVELDDWLGTIMARLEELGIADRTLVYVTTDHGFDEGASRHSNAPYGIFASNDPRVMRSGVRKDVAATILDRYGVSLEALGGAPAVDGFSLYAPPPWTCTPEGEAWIDDPASPA
ncbi:MAG: alkaline phosphatase family protein, partial [Anaerolineae bacterium]